MARETQLNNVIRSRSDCYSPNDRATAEIPYAVEALEARLRSRPVLPDETAPRRSWAWRVVAAVLSGLGSLLFVGGRT